ncbi:hypothetical protein EMIHUDRAFT_454432 [Emiliania huxleyi CCMP1516]|uniref:Calcineurin-like phosphoesterase domain-containing protein n=2 Tax=Emiliania huxleyi TaxID=2903 RepID=A0A0D3KUC4_EMIH1|nr:hypothetical protein EMIHUDRAFT_454432 [Emiliania huxleyi CCMP1516]EOD39359.1 hypothetical protein EMIHUDRAFT_454432 [Emiliania huxleyi CCMP1516]|eukprot:XP_005791788.1 hypothetical protein EMIHUDRAFT_454432 [Emiliania huxleyi CCMP1516]
MGSPPEPHDKISYVTDIEGNWEFFVRFIDLSEALSLIALPAHGSPAAQVDLQDGWQLVVGGDCCDKGGAVGGSIRVVSTLVELKRRYPTRVTLILGNRDVNKMRMTSELSEGQLAHERLSTIPGPYWVPESKRVAPCAFLRATAAQQLGRAGLAASLSVAELASGYNTLPNRLRWMLKETMGADGEFERRRAELESEDTRRLAYSPRRAEIALLRGSDAEHALAVRKAAESSESEARDGRRPRPSSRAEAALGVTDAEVCESFVSSVAPGGFMRGLLDAGQLACIIGSTLFLHGGVQSRGGCALGRVPGREGEVQSPREWADALNACVQTGTLAPAGRTRA